MKDASRNVFDRPVIFFGLAILSSTSRVEMVRMVDDETAAWPLPCCHRSQIPRPSIPDAKGITGHECGQNQCDPGQSVMPIAILRDLTRWGLLARLTGSGIGLLALSPAAHATDITTTDPGAP